MCYLHHVETMLKMLRGIKTSFIFSNQHWWSIKNSSDCLKIKRNILHQKAGRLRNDKSPSSEDSPNASEKRGASAKKSVGTREKDLWMEIVK